MWNGGGRVPLRRCGYATGVVLFGLIVVLGVWRKDEP